MNEQIVQSKTTTLLERDHSSGGRPPCRRHGRRDANVGHVGEFLRPPERPFGEPVLGVRLELPRDSANQVLLVPAADCLAENVDVALLEVIYAKMDRNRAADIMSEGG